VLASGQNRPKKQFEGVRFLLIRYSNYSAIWSKIHAYRPLFRRFCPLGSNSH